jgi:hypothetical protein
MRRLFILASLFLSLEATAQVTEIRSIELDRMIWDEINIYRQTLGRKPVAYFDSTELRQVSFRITELNASRPEIIHTEGEFRFKGYNVECIAAYRHKQEPARGNPLYDTVLTIDEKKMIAKQIVSQWIESNDHNYLIGGKYVKYSTITTITKVDGNSIRIVASYHAIFPQSSEFDDYY